MRGSGSRSCPRLRAPGPRPPAVRGVAAPAAAPRRRAGAAAHRARHARGHRPGGVRRAGPPRAAGQRRDRPQARGGRRGRGADRARGADRPAGPGRAGQPGDRRPAGAAGVSGGGGFMMTDHDPDAASSADTAGSALRSGGWPKLERDLFIGNQWRPGSTGQTISLVNPATEQPFGRAAAASADDVDAAVKAARPAFDPGPWPRLSLQGRAAPLLRFPDALEGAIQPLAELVMRETGLPWKEGIRGNTALTTTLRD